MRRNQITTSSAKSRDVIWRPPKPKVSVTWLHLEMLSIKVLNSISDNLPGQNPNLAGKRSNLLPAKEQAVSLSPYAIVQGLNCQKQFLYTPKAFPTDCSKVRSRIASPSPQNTQCQFP